MTLPVLIDCDTGIDDAIALTYLACRSDVEIIGVVSTGGNVPVPAVHRNNLALADLLGISAPISLGAARPLVQEPMFADDTHGPQGLGHAVLPDPGRSEDPRSGAQLWVDTARAHPGELVGLVLGPHTNLALALEIEPELPRLLRRLHIMGGAINHRGNTGATSEWNFAVDPEAAQRVLAAFSGAPVRPVLGSLEATESVRFTQDTLDRVRQFGASTGHPVAMILTEALRFYFEFHRADGFGWTAHVHDPLVAAHAVTGQFAATRPLAVDVELAGTLTRGQSVGDELGRWGREPNVDVLRDVQPESFIEHLLATLGDGLARLAPR
ncbi:nucleoside hydrolase [Brachybacterium sacelli]|uniref:Inosine-uridine nucleoside N-ribohydrolase n=1 Tax=Brachybacterium sacelli TaxID=173364 RepID=A0ABS4X433_9MICO|nr:nucleoside hydrolase [Brachybacterium sacelli]MBP2383225.1 inosine-uridine nucleoside N-ribohydrolase [Brachybacterium sacelli]